MKFYTRQKKPIFINIVSLIDVLTMLLIFFVVTTTFKKDQSRVRIDLPESSRAEKTKAIAEPIMIRVTKENRISVGGEENLSLEDLPKVLKAKKTSMPEAVFALEADKGVELGFFVKVLDASKDAGIENLSLHTKEPEANFQQAN